MGRINSECDKIKNQLIIEYLLSYFCQLNTLKGTAKAPTVDLSRLNNLRQPIRKVMGEGGEKTKKIMQGRVTDKKIVQRRGEGKTPCRVNCTDALTNCIRLRGNLAATLYCSVSVIS